MSPQKSKIFSIATKAGFTNFGVAKAAPLNRGWESLREWLDRGYNAPL